MGEAQHPPAQGLRSTHPPHGCQPLCSPHCVNLPVLEPVPQWARSSPSQAPNCSLRQPWPLRTQALEQTNRGTHTSALQGPNSALNGGWGDGGGPAGQKEPL